LTPAILSLNLGTRTCPAGRSAKARNGLHSGIARQRGTRQTQGSLATAFIIPNERSLSIAFYVSYFFK